MKAIKRFAMLLAVLSPFLLNVSFGFADTATRTCSACGQKFTVTTPAADDAKTFEAYNKVNSIKGVESDKSATYTAITDANVYATTINGKPLCSNCLRIAENGFHSAACERNGGLYDYGSRNC